MPANYILDVGAIRDSDNIVDCYDAQRAGLGTQFADELQACIDRVCVTPRGGSAFHGRFRRANLQRFPYFVIYTFDGTTVIVRAVSHVARDPTALQSRLGDP